MRCVATLLLAITSTSKLKIDVFATLLRPVDREASLRSISHQIIFVGEVSCGAGRSEAGREVPQLQHLGAQTNVLMNAVPQIVPATKEQRTTEVVRIELYKGRVRKKTKEE